MNAPPNTAAEERLIEETLRLYQRYQREIVEGLNLCPWAKRAREDGRVHYWVCTQKQPAVDPILSQLDAWEDDSQVEIGLIILPLLDVNRSAFERFATAVMAGDAARHQLTSPPFVLAAFHPEAELQADTPERLIPFLRRSPDPTLQVVRVSALERVRQGESGGTQFMDLSQVDLSKLSFDKRPPLNERVAAANLETIQQLGADRARALIRDIHEDHAATRRRLRDGGAGDDDAPG